MKNILSIVLSVILIPSISLAEISAQMQEKLQSKFTDEQIDRFNELQTQIEEAQETSKAPFRVLYCVNSEDAILTVTGRLMKCYENMLVSWIEYDVFAMLGGSGFGLELTAGASIAFYFGNTADIQGEYSGGGMSAAYGAGGSIHSFSKKDGRLIFLGGLVGIGGSVSNTKQPSYARFPDSTITLKKAK